MIFVIGGYCQGKADFVRETFGPAPDSFTDGAVCPVEGLQDLKVLSHFHALVRRWLSAGLDPERAMTALLASNPDLILISDEQGCGLIPMDPEEAAFRECHGRLCCRAAARADAVYRVVCGIGQKIK